MMHPAFSAYLADLKNAAAALPESERRDIVADVTEHFASAEAERPLSDQLARDVIEHLGSPDHIVAAAAPAPVAFSTPQSQTLEHLGIGCLAVVPMAMILPPLGVLLGLVGVAIVVFSRWFPLKEKAITAAVFLGLPSAVMAAGAMAWQNTTIVDGAQPSTSDEASLFIVIAMAVVFLTLMWGQCWRLARALRSSAR